MKDYNTYIFDLYGTLVDIHTDETKKSFWKRMALYYTLNGAPYKGKELRKSYTKLVSKLEKRLQDEMDARCTNGDKIEIDLLKVFEKLFENKEVTPSKEMLEATAIMFRTLSIEHLNLFDGAKEILCKLKQAGKKIYLLSNAQAAFTVPELKALGIYELFDGIMISSMAGVKKPANGFFEALINKYDIDKSRAIMVGNDYYDDIMGATAYGLDSIYIDTPQSRPFKEKLPESCKQIKRIFKLFA